MSSPIGPKPDLIDDSQPRNMGQDAYQDEWRLGCVSFLNSKPLIDGFSHTGSKISFDVPSALLDQLLQKKVDLALCPAIDFQLSPKPLTIIPMGAICCDGPTYTVRLFSKVPIKNIKSIALDPDSHTSIRLLKIVLHDVYGLDHAGITYTPLLEADKTDAQLLIGDKVVTDPPAGVHHELDLGSAWKQLTGLPFVFAIWMMLDERYQGLNTRGQARLNELILYMEELKQLNIRNLPLLLDRYAAEMGWPHELAGQYLGEWLHYDMSQRHLTAMELYFERADKLDLLPGKRALNERTHLTNISLAG